MNKRQKEMLQHQFDSEKAVLKQLEKQYQTALNDINRKIRILQSDEMTQSKIYRLEYQKALKKQVEAILEKLHSDEFTTIQEYLSASYTDSFIGTMYDLAGQGIPLIIPLDQAAAVTAILTDSKISEGLYSALGVDTGNLKKAISAEVTRGIASGMAYNDIARNISNVSKAPLSRAKTIVRTEGHRIQQKSTKDAQQQAKSKGADVVKQWDSTLDGKTRPSHKKVDGEIRELDEKFSNGLDYPGDPGGKAGEVVNCRCVSLSRARWALDEDELNTLKERASFFELDKTKTFEDFKKKYLPASEQVAKAKTVQNPAKNKFGDIIVFAERLNQEKWASSVKIIKELADEYDTRLTTVGVGAGDAAGSVGLGGAMKLSTTAPETTFHEFAHSIAQETLTKYGVTDDSAFWKEVKAVRRAYKKDVGDDSSRWISAYEHSSTKTDEFFAEAFTQAKMTEKGIELPAAYGKDLTYSNKVLEIVDKYFKKPLEKSSKSSTMKAKEMFSKKDNARSGFKFISNERFEQLTIAAKKKGAVILRGTDEIERHLDAMEASASTIGDVLLFRNDVCISEVLEETYHFSQNIDKVNDDKGEPLRTILNEIDAKKYVLRNADKYKIPRNELDLVKQQLEGYERQLEEFKKGGK